jgi:hypothetical protein
VGKVKIPYYVTRRAWPGSRATWGYWAPSKKMKAAGFSTVACGEDGPEAWTIAATWNTRWQEVRASGGALVLHKGDVAKREEIAAESPERKFPEGSVGEAYWRAMALRAAERKAKGRIWTKEHESRDDWPRAWKWLGPVLGDLKPDEVQPEYFLAIDEKTGEVAGLLPKIEQLVSKSERHRTIKVWRALWKKMVAMKYCTDEEADPSLTFANSVPDARQASWLDEEWLLIVERAWTMKYYGLAALLAVAWDSQLSPIDARTLVPRQARRDGRGIWFDVERTKTGAPAIATISPRAEELLTAYLEMLGFDLHDEAPIFRNRSGAPYSKDTLGDDFRAARRAEFGRAEKRQLQDGRRSGSIEAVAGRADPGGMSKKMGNTIGHSNRLHGTYVPARVAIVREVDEARAVGRDRLRTQGPTVEGSAALRPKVEQKS